MRYIRGSSFSLPQFAFLGFQAIAMRPSVSRSLSLPMRRHVEVSRKRCRQLSVLAQATTTPNPRHGTPAVSDDSPIRRRPEPYSLVAPELTHIRKCLLDLLGTAHPGLAPIAEGYFLQPTKQLRSLVVLLFSRAINGSGRHWEQKDWEATCQTRTRRSEEFDSPLNRSDVLNEWNPSMPDYTASFESVFALQQPAWRPAYPPPCPRPILAKNISPRLACPPSVLPTQIRLAQIVEMVHIASLIHDGITPAAEEDKPNSESGTGNKMAILGGDFLLGRASWALSRLGENEVVELIANVISNQVEGEFLRMGEIKTPELGLLPGPERLADAWNLYRRKTYLRTASLIAKGARSAVILGGCHEGDALKEIAYLYGRNLGIALQLSEDARQVTQMQPGLATSPALFASEECPRLLPLIQRNFRNSGDLEEAVEYILTTSGVERTHILAESYAVKAREALDLIPDSETKLALDALIDTVVQRT